MNLVPALRLLNILIPSNNCHEVQDPHKKSRTLAFTRPTFPPTMILMTLSFEIYTSSDTKIFMNLHPSIGNPTRRLKSQWPRHLII